MNKEVWTALGRFFDTRSLGSALVVLVVIAGTVSTKWAETLGDAAFIVNEPLYYVLASDLYKQGEKIAEDPEDLKKADVDKFARFCTAGDPFIDRYVPERPDARALQGVCQRVLELADHWPS